MTEAPDRPRIGLAMIVRDEAAVIDRCLDSAIDLIGSWTICDTGSRDGTAKRIEARLGHLPGRLHRSAWRDFGSNRSELMARARGSADYLLLLDADHTVEVEDGFDPAALHADAYELLHAGPLAYRVPRLVRGDLPWRFVGATHEYLALDGESSRLPLDELVIHHHADGGSRRHKFERDERLLRGERERDPDDPRTVFYLAQTLRDLGRREEAAQLFLERRGMGGWDEEVFYSALQAGVLAADSDADRAVALLEEAAELRPSRAEPLYELARVHRFRRDYGAALSAARRGRLRPEPPDRLFVHTDVYRWGLLFELGTAAHLCGRHAEAARALAAVIACGEAPAEFRAAASWTRERSLEALPATVDRIVRSAPTAISRLVPGTEMAGIVLDVAPAWPAFNPSITRWGEGFALAVRTANYRIDGGGRYRMLDGDTRVKTLNYLVDLDPELTVRDIRPLADPELEPRPLPGARIIGLEDLRLIAHAGRLHAVATARDRNRDQRAQVALLEVEAGAITALQLPEMPVPGRHEKNWMPFSLGEGVGLVYSISPEVVLSWNPGDRALAQLRGDPFAVATPPLLRGGSQGLRIPGGRLFVVHEVRWESGQRSYLHRLALLDEDLRLSALSVAFSFVGDGIEYCAGLARGPRGLVLSFGAGDRLAGLAVCDEDALLGLLEPVRSPELPF